MVYWTHQGAPLLNIIHGIYPNPKVPCESKDLNPIQQIGCEELLDCFLYLPNVGTATRDPQEVLCPELACIFQAITNVVLPAIRKILDITENRIAIQIADVPL